MSQGEPLTSKVNSPARGNGAEDHGTHPQREGAGRRNRTQRLHPAVALGSSSRSHQAHG